MLLKKYNIYDKKVFALPYKKRFVQLYDLMKKGLKEKETHFIELCSLYLQEMIVTVSNEIIKQDSASSEPEALTAVIQYLEEHYFEDLSVNDLARIGKTNPKTLTRYFAKYRNVTPIKYLIDLRIKKAKILLLQTSLKIGEVALAIGFQDTLYFTTVFHKSTGITPSEYRKRVAEGIAR